MHNLYCLCGWESSKMQSNAWKGPKEDFAAGDRDPSRCRFLWGHSAFPECPHGVIPSSWEPSQTTRTVLRCHHTKSACQLEARQPHEQT